MAAVAWTIVPSARAPAQDDVSDAALDAAPPEQRGDLLMERHAWVEAEYAYSLAPANAVLWNKRGIAWHHLLAIGAARSDYEKALQLRPEYADAVNNLGATYFAVGRYKRALAYYFRALRLEPGSAVIRANVGTAYFAMGKIAQGAEAYRAAYVLDPDVFDQDRQQIVQGPTTESERARLDLCLAEIFASSNDVERAIEYLRRAASTGHLDRKRLMQAPAFASLRATPQFAEFRTEPGVQ
jgi:tetratricopeptide (TPR) repeat protein